MKLLAAMTAVAWVFVLPPALAAAQQAETVPPTDIATGTATPTENSARVLGYFNYGNTMPLGIAKQCWFDYGTTSAFGSRESAVCSGTTIATLAPLLSGTLYYYRAGASNEAGTSYGPVIKTFTTLGSSPPPGTQPPPDTPPSAKLEVISRQSLSSVLRRGLRLRATVTGTCPCTVVTDLVVNRSTAKRLGLRGLRTIGTARKAYAVAGAARLTPKARLAVRRKLRLARALKVLVRVTVDGAHGETFKTSRSLRLKRSP